MMSPHHLQSSLYYWCKVCIVIYTLPMFSQSIKPGFSISEEHSSPIKYDVVIIGAGLSGLTAAFRLFQLRHNLSIKILEAQDRIGGRLLTTELPASNNTTDQWDLGGTWIGNKNIQPFINQLLSELNIQTYGQNFTGKKVIQTGSDHKISRYSASIPDIGLFSLFDTTTLLKYIESTQSNLCNVAKMADNKKYEYDSLTAESFVRKKIWTQSTSDMTKAATRACFGAELEKLSCLYFLIYSNSCGGFLKMIESSKESSQGFKIVGGAQGICTRIMEIIGFENLALGTVVKSIYQQTNEKEEHHLLIDTTGDSYKATSVILALPPHLITNIQFIPALSPIKYEFFSSISPGHLIKVILTYEKPFWILDGYSGEVVTNGGPSFTAGCLTGPLCVVFDATTSNRSPALIGLIGGEQALQYESVSKEERKEAVLKSLETFFNKSAVRDFIVYCEKIWRQEPFVGGCPVSSVPPGVAKYMGVTLRSSERGIHFAGSEMGKKWIGFMEGAVESGERAALEVLSDNFQ